MSDFGKSGVASIEVQDEGVVQGNASKLDFTGAGVTATVVGDKATVNIPGGGGYPAKFQFGNTVSVPAGGTLQLQGPGNTLSGLRVNRAGNITGASIQVNVADGARSYNLDIRVNGVSVATLALPAGSSGAHTAALAVAVAAGDVITAFMVRTAGAGPSAFGEEHSVVEVTF